MHLRGRGCYECSGHKLLGNEKFIEKAKNVHGDKYDYSKVNYIGSKDKVCIICPEHGEFWQIPNSHLMGIGCPLCSASKLENEVGKVLIENNIKFVSEKKFEWMGGLKLDFYLPEKKIAIECQGLQHFEPIGFFGGEDALIANKERDERKRILCENNGITVIYYFDNEKYFGSYEKEAHNIIDLKEFLK
jgi:very-short-patch-repair endonuclease